MFHAVTQYLVFIGQSTPTHVLIRFSLPCLQFDRERIPERVVHARGVTAKGFFEVMPIIFDVSLDLYVAMAYELFWIMSTHLLYLIM